MLRLFILGLTLLGAGQLAAQQVPMYSQYFFNNYAYNPAVGGTQSTVNVASNHRYQWVGLQDAPRTYTLTVEGPLNNQKMGLGAFLFTDNVGPTRRTGLQFSYSYIFKVTEKVKLSLGLSAGILEWKLDGHKVHLYSAGDQVLVNAVMRTIVPDASFGFHLFHKKWFFGASAPNLLHNKLKFSNAQYTAQSVMEDHYYINGGYKFDLGDDFQIEPALMIKFVTPAPIQFDPMVRLIWKDQIWLGGVFRAMVGADGFQTNAASAMIGFTYKQNLQIGYSYDFAISNLNNYSNGTHELMLGVKFNKAQSFESSKDTKGSFE
ncbi:MAG: type IX secretion system membrane protein PorP/SprF [Flavobacteriales bacterium]|nr:type IX secretion system membrane protein PorP/SprF [Flavobacteriales bacterium]